MYLLKRKISPYSGFDQILGVFTTSEKAKNAKLNFIEKRLKEDPWKKQAYHEVNLEKDIIIEDISHLFKKESSLNKNKFFLICHREDYLGLCSLKLEKIFFERKHIDSYIKLQEKDDNWTGELKIYEIFENVLYKEDSPNYPIVEKPQHIASEKQEGFFSKFIKYLKEKFSPSK